MTSRLNISVPATLTVLGGDPALSSLGGVRPGVTVSGAAPADTISVQLIAGNAAASMTVASAAGVVVDAQSNTLSLTGTQAQVNAALAGLALDEPVDAGRDVLSLSATDTAALGVSSGFAVDVVPATGPAFVAPPASLTTQPNAPSAVAGLVLADPIAAGLAAMGRGAEETLSLTLSVARGVLLLPGIDSLAGIAATGLGTGTIELSLSADDIGALNTLLAGLEFAGPAGTQFLDYALWNEAGVLPVSLTRGKIFLHTTGPVAPNGVHVAGTQTLITGGTVFTGTLAVSGIDTVLGELSGGTIAIAPGGVLELPYDNMSLSGTAAEFGTLTAGALDLTGALLAGGVASFAAPLTLAAGARLALGEGLIADGASFNSLDVALSLAAGAVLEGSGTLTAGNFSEAAVISGGTLLAPGGDTLEIDAGLVTGGAQLQVGGGGVMVLGPVSPLYGVFATTPLTIDNSVTLSFLEPGALPIGGGYAGTLGGSGGAFVISGPAYFSGTVTGFGAGDALIFPDLASISIFNVSASSFSIAGIDVSGATVTYAIHTSLTAGYAPAVAQDAQGDEEVVMRPPAATLTQGAALAATPGVPQPLLGASITMPGSTTQSLAVTLAAALGQLSRNGGTLAPRITLTASSLAALNQEIDAVSYSGTGVADTVVFTSNTGLLAGLTGDLFIGVGTAGTVSGYSGQVVTQADVVSFGTAGGLPVITAPMAAGAAQVSGVAEFEGVMRATGLSGTALVVDDAGAAIFGTAARVTLGADVTIGDAAGAGTLMVLSPDFYAGGNVTLAQAAAGAGARAAVLGAMEIAGTLVIGARAGATMLAEGTLASAAMTLGTAGVLRGFGTADVQTGGLGNGGTIFLADAARLEAASYQGAGVLDLGGTATFAVAGQAVTSGAAHVTIGAGAALTAGSLVAAGGLFDAGLITVAGAAQTGNMTLAGGTFAAAAVQLGGTASGYGVISAATIADNGVVLASGGRLLLNGNVSGTGPLEIAGGASLELGGTPGAGAVTFMAGNAVFVLDNAAASSFSATQLSISDAIDLVGVAPSLVVVPGLGGGAGVILDSQGGTASSFGITLAGTAQHHIAVTSDGAGGTLLTVDGVLPCFARGTGILGPHGYRPVESLRPNDPVITANGERRPVRWIGWRTLDLGPAAQAAARPVLIMPGAFGPGKPAKMLRLSPSHCIFISGCLIPAELLVNGATVLRDAAAQAATYFHIELDRHDILLTEGLECESYFDDGNRAAMYQELGRRCPARKPYAPVVRGGLALAAARRALHQQALATGFSTRFQPVLRAVAAGQSVIPEILRVGQGRVARFAFPRPVRELVLLSATAAPADTDPESEDRRALGVCLGTVQGVQLGVGWQARAVGDAGTWMGACAALAWPRARAKISLPLAAIAQSWHRQPVDARPVDVRRQGG